MSELILVPTPIQEELPLEPVAQARLLEDALKPDVMILVEEHKIGRQRWLKWGLPREAIEKFVLFNEHTQEKIQSDIIKELSNGKRVYLLSDCGLPAFEDGARAWPSGVGASRVYRSRSDLRETTGRAQACPHI